MAWRRLTAWVAVAVLSVLASARAVREVWSAPRPTEANIALTPGQDFRDATYYPIKELLSGGNPYLPSNMLDHWPVRQEYGLYVPSHLVMNLPFAAFDYRTSLILFSVLSLGCLFAIGIVCARTYRLPGSWTTAWLAGALVVLSQLGKSAIYFGQINALAGLGGVLALTQARRHPAWSAVGLALAWTKPQYGIPLLILLVARRAWREALGGTAIAFVVSLPVVGVLVARDGLLGFVRVLRENVDYSATIYYTAVDSMRGTRIDVAAVFYRLTGWLPPFAEIGVFLIVLGVAALLLRRGRGPLDATDLLLVSTACMICIVHQQREALLTVPGLVAVVACLLRREPVPRLLVVAAVLVLLPGAHVAFVESYLQGMSPWFDGIWEGVAMIAAYCVVVASAVLSRHRSRRPETVTT